MRSATPADLPAIAEIYAHYVANSTATFELEAPGVVEWHNRFDAITEAGLPFLVAEAEGRTAGYAYCTRWKPRPAYLHTVEDSIYLAPWAVGRGLGGALLDELLAQCSAHGIREVIAVVATTGEATTSDTASEALHRKRGFVEAGRLSRVGYKHERWLDTMLLQRSLPTT